MRRNCPTICPVLTKQSHIFFDPWSTEVLAPDVNLLKAVTKTRPPYMLAFFPAYVVRTEKRVVMSLRHPSSISTDATGFFIPGSIAIHIIRYRSWLGERSQGTCSILTSRL